MRCFVGHTTSFDYDIPTSISTKESLHNMINDDYDVYLLTLDNQEMGVPSEVKQII